MNFTPQEIWFLQTTLNQKAKEHVMILSDEHYSFANILNFIAIKFPVYEDLQDRYKKYLCHASLTQVTYSESILMRSDIEHLRGKSLSLQAPLALEYRGNPTLLSKKTIGIVGSRHPTFYGRLQAQKFARALSKLGYVVVSGGAIGVDAIANTYSLESSQGGSISIIGNGIANPYPSSNHSLFYKLSHAANGLLLSEFESHETAKKWNFPARNATIAELCDFLLVIEATPTSGSLMTARFAKECGKDVGALPGNINNPNTTGSHLLIQQGAHCIQDPKDIVQYL